MSAILQKCLRHFPLQQSVRRLSIPNPLSTSLPSSYKAALDTVASIPDIKSAQKTLDFSTAQSHYERTIAILERQREQNPLLELAARENYASLLHRVGDVAGEWEQRKVVAEGVRGGRLWNALALCGMRGGGKYRESVQWAGECARETRNEEGDHDEIGWGVLGALQSGIAMGERGRVVVEGVAKMASGLNLNGVDVGGWANVFVGLSLGGVQGAHLILAVAEKRKTALSKSLSEGQSMFEVVDLQCAAARLLMKDDKDGKKEAEDVLQRALAVSKKSGSTIDTTEPLTCLAEFYVRSGEAVLAEGLYRSVEDKFRVLEERKAFTPSSADVFCRAMKGYSELLRAIEFNGKKREKEAEAVAERVKQIQNLFPQIFQQPPLAPLFYVDAVMPQLASVSS